MRQPILQAGELRSVGTIAEGVWGKRLFMVNVYLIREGDRFVLLDAGLPGTRGIIKRWVEKITGGRRPESIILTHGHFDHVGALATLSEEWDVPVFVHSAEYPYVTGGSAYPSPDPTVGRGLMSLLSPLYPKGPFNFGTRVEVLSPDGEVPGLREWKWVATPGHSPGHVSLYRERDGVLLAGDAFNTTKQESLRYVITQNFHLEGPPAYFTPDWTQAALSVNRLAKLNVRVAAPGHGRALHGSAPMRCLIYLAKHFNELGLPKQGRYLTPEDRVLSIQAKSVEV